jgi:hypothetical protein
MVTSTIDSCFTHIILFQLDGIFGVLLISDWYHFNICALLSIFNRQIGTLPWYVCWELMFEVMRRRKPYFELE